MISDLTVKNIGTALHSWLNYTSAVERSYVLAENSIIYPVSEFIGTKTNPNNIWLDRAHPNLKGKRLDLRFNINFGGTNNEVAFEFKYAREDYTENDGEKQRILNDLLRLKIFYDSELNRKAYFLICGEQLEFLKSFQSIGWSQNHDDIGRPLENTITIDSIQDLNVIEPHGHYTNWFSFNMNDDNEDAKLTVFNITDTNIIAQDLLDGFYEEYENSFKESMNRTSLEATQLCTRLIYLSDLNNLDGVNDLMRVGIWEISSIQNTK